MQVGNIGAGTLIWKKDTRLISAGALIIRKDPRLRLEGYNLTLAGVKPEDEGEYICQVETFNLEPIQQSSALTVLIPARVEPLPQSGQREKMKEDFDFFLNLFAAVIYYKELILCVQASTQ